MKLTKKGHTVPFVTFALLFDQFLLDESNCLLQIPKLNEKSPNLFQKFSQDNGILNFLNKICENTLVDFNIIYFQVIPLLEELNIPSFAIQF